MDAKALKASGNYPRFYMVAYELMRSLRSMIGLGDTVYMFAGGHKLDPDTRDYLVSMGFQLMEGFGMAESTGSISANMETLQKWGTSGKVFDGLECEVRKIAALDKREFDGDLNGDNNANDPDKVKDDDVVDRALSIAVKKDMDMKKRKSAIKGSNGAISPSKNPKIEEFSERDTVPPFVDAAETLNQKKRKVTESSVNTELNMNSD
jgi:hypothetical protein